MKKTIVATILLILAIYVNPLLGYVTSEELRPQNGPYTMSLEEVKSIGLDKLVEIENMPAVYEPPVGSYRSSTKNIISFNSKTGEKHYNSKMVDLFMDSFLSRNKENLSGYISIRAEEEEMQLGFFEKLYIYPVYYLAKQTSWHLHAVNWASWGLLFSGASLLVFPSFYNQDLRLLAGGVTIMAPTAIMKTTAFLFGKFGLFNAMRLTSFFKNFQESLKRTDIYGDPLPKKYVLENSWNISWFQGVMEYIKFELLLINLPPQWRFISSTFALNVSPSFAVASYARSPIINKTALIAVSLPGVIICEFLRKSIWEIKFRWLRFSSPQRFAENYGIYEYLMIASWPKAKEEFFSFFSLMALGFLGSIFFSLKNNASVNLSSGKSTIYSFHEICSKGSKQKLHKAIKARVNINDRNRNGKSPLLCAAENNLDTGVISLLIKNGADISLRGEDGSNALMLAAKSNDNPDIVSILVKNGIDLDSRDANGLTALMLAAKYSYNPKVVLALLNAGADPNAKDTNGLTALDYIKGNEAIKDSNAYWKLHDASFE